VADFVANFVAKFVADFVAKFVADFVAKFVADFGGEICDFCAFCGRSSLNIRIADFVTDSSPNDRFTGSTYENVAFVSGITRAAWPPQFTETSWSQ
jgi:hypothetical protein